MKLGFLLCSVALPPFWATAATGQISIPLPQKPVLPPENPQEKGSTEIPLPGASLPAPPLFNEPQIPLGPHGRPDINPYDRDIDMTVPLTFLNQSLGEIPMRLTADDRFTLETDVFIRLMQAVLNDEAQASLSGALNGTVTFDPEDLEKTGIVLSYDPTTLAVVVVDVAPDRRATANLFAPPRDDLNDVSLQPANLSGYLNLNLVQSYIWEAGKVDPPTVAFEGAIRLGRFVFEGDARFGQRFGLDESKYEFNRNYARVVFDQPEQYRRWFAGDLDPESRGFQSYVQMGGVGVLRQRRRFNTFRAAVLQADRNLVVQRESTVRFIRNGTLYREMRLQPGRYDFGSLPLVAGSNDIEVQVIDNSGAVQNLSYQQYLDPIDLDPGDHEYGAFLGPTSKRFDGAPDYRGPVAFTGFFRKAFFDKPAVGIGLQLSENVQLLTGQTQFILPNGGRLLLDAGASNTKAVGQGFAGGASYEHVFDRGGTSDSMVVRADYFSPKFASLGNPEAINSTKLTASVQYTKMLTERVMATSTASYIKSRFGRGDSYRIGATGYYRMDSRWTFRAGADYSKFPSTFGRSGGFSFSVGITFQPDYRRRSEARYESLEKLAEVSYNQSGLNQMNSVGFGGIAAHQDGQVRAQGFASYSANRFDAAVSHASFGPSLADFGSINATTVRFGTTVAVADGTVGVGRRINDSFMLLTSHKTLGDRSVVAGQSLANNDYIGRSGALGAAVHNFLGSYALQSVHYDVEDPPAGYDTGPGVVRVYPPYKSGYTYRVGTEAFVSVMGTLVLAPDNPVSLVGGRVTLLDVKEGDEPKPIPFFTNTAGRFAIPSLLPGRKYLVETYGRNGSVERSFEFTVPTNTDGLVNLGTVMPGSKN